MPSRIGGADLTVPVRDPRKRQEPAGRLARGLLLVLASHGFRSSMLLAGGTLVLSAAGYLFNLACIRFLGPAGYGDVAAMMAVAALVALPLGSIQLLIAREIANLGARKGAAHVRWMLRRVLSIALPVTLCVVAAGVVASAPLGEALKIASPVTVAVGLTGVGVSVVAILLYGFLQGAQRFTALASAYAVSGLMRPALVVPALALGLGAAGALAANTLAGLVAVGLGAWALRDLWRGEIDGAAFRVERGQVAVLLGGSLAFAALTNADVLLASIFLSDREAGLYAAAAFVGKVVLFLPSAVATVVLPKATFRFAMGLASRVLLSVSLATTAVVTLAAALALAFTPESVLVWAFGPDFRDATGLLGWFGFAMAAAALVNIYLAVYFAERNVGFPVLVGVAAVAQVATIVLWHPTTTSIVLVTLACNGAVLLVHEVAFPHRVASVWGQRRRRVATLGSADPPPIGPP